MTKTETTLLKQFIGKLADKDFSDANSLLEKVMAEKLKNQVRKVVQKNQAETNK